MKLVILGAGASYDAFSWYKDKDIFENWRPPLANEIFDTRKEFLNIIETYPGSNALFSEIGLGGDIENFFQSRYELSKNPNAIEIEKKLINVKFFLQHLFSEISGKLKNAGTNNITRLISLINDYVIKTEEEVLIVNFNYDLLVEDVLRNNYYNSSTTMYSMHDYLHHKIKLIKPHGSCNWHRAFTVNAFRLGHNERLWQYMFSNNFTQEKIDSLLQNDFYTLPYHSEMIKISNQFQYLFPQIYIPLKSKDGFAMPKEQEDYLLEFLPKVTEILIIGWKGNESHFNEILKDKIADQKIKIEIVNGPHFVNPGLVLENIGKSIDISNSHIFKDEADLDRMRLKLPIHEFMDKSVLSGSLSSFLINIEQGNHKSIFN